MKRLLMIAYHFPPLAGSSGIQRTISFARHLPPLGWEPLVLTAHPRAYERVSHDQLGDLPPDTVVERAFALDAARHLAVKGRYPGFAARPDRWVSWWLGAVPKGLAMIRTYRPDAIWSTYPIATAHMIGHTLHRLSHLPWIADFRDPMAQDGYPADPRIWRSFKRDRGNRGAARPFIFRCARCGAHVASGTDAPGARLAVVENGYDEESFAPHGNASMRSDRCFPTFTLVHSARHPSERDPRCSRPFDGCSPPGSLKPGAAACAPRTRGFSEADRGNRVGEIVEIAPPGPIAKHWRMLRRRLVSSFQLQRSDPGRRTNTRAAGGRSRPDRPGRRHRGCWRELAAGARTAGLGGRNRRRAAPLPDSEARRRCLPAKPRCRSPRLHRAQEPELPHD
jgi:hypothetical protein